MRNEFRALAAVLTLAASTGLVVAQQNPLAPSQTNQNTLNPNNNQSGGPGPKEGQVVPVSPIGQGTSQVQATDVPGAGKQTMPSTLSAENYAKDHHPWLDRGVILTSAQKKLIYAALAKGKEAMATGGDKIFAVVQAVLPSSLEPQDLPAELAAQVPYIKDLKYVRTGDKVLLVNAPNMYVNAVIGPQG
ncbi:MAG TPA: hypothetical protein VGQ97_03855 [Xanthobacteraceae bacterium]|nr:hypothetical protein [Xanthobacteraceae bacterium]